MGDSLTLLDLFIEYLQIHIFILQSPENVKENYNVMNCLQ